MENIKGHILKGLRVGLTAFFICFGVAFIAGLIMNYGFMDEINRFVNGSLSEDPKPTISSLLLVVSSILNLSVFNNGGILENGSTMHIGMLIFIALPVIAFWIADQSTNKEKHFDFTDMVEYLSSSTIFAVVLFAFSIVVKGDLLGLYIDFSNPMNIVMMVIILMCVQVFIGMNYNKDFTPGVDKTRFVIRLLLIIGLVLAVLGMGFMFFKLGVGFFMGLGVIILMAPNIAIYILFTFMGASIEFSDQLMTIFNTFDIDLSFAVLPLGLRLVLILVFFGLIFYSILKLDEEGFIKNVLYFAGSFSVISFVLAYSTKMNLGFVKGWVDVEFKINELFAFMMPAGLVILAGALVYLVRYLMVELKKDGDV